MSHSTTISKPIIEAFNTKARWNLFGSVVYESLRIGQSAIMAMLFTPEAFGMIGSIFASTYLIVRLSDCGATNALFPFFGYLEQSQATFKLFFTKRLLYPLMVTNFFGAIITGFVLHNSQLQDLVACTYIIPFLVFSETLRSFLRQFLHLAGQYKLTLIVDHSILYVYMLVCLPSIFYLPHLRTPSFLFSLFLVDSLVGLVSFFILTARYAKKLPLTAPTTHAVELPSWYQLTSARGYAWLLRICKELFSSNTLTPLFAATVGLKEAGLFYFAATFAMALHAVMRSIISYAGGSLMISGRKAQLPSQQTFALVSRKLTSILFVLAVFFALTYNDILTLSKIVSTTSLITLFFILYFSIVIIEFSLFLYEQQYQLEQAASKALQWRLLELLLVYVVAQKMSFLNPVSVLICILTAKIGTLIALGVAGYRQWGIQPSLHIPLRRMFFLTSVSITLALALKILIWYMRSTY